MIFYMFYKAKWLQFIIKEQQGDSKSILATIYNAGLTVNAHDEKSEP